jgi:hypothetical protein
MARSSFCVWIALGAASLILARDFGGGEDAKRISDLLSKKVIGRKGDDGGTD